MKISAHTLITNSHSSGYLAYLPAIQSFLEFADEVIVVDGGSTDESLDNLKLLRGQEKLKIVSSEHTYWGSGDNWEWPQIAINRQVGFELCEGDWAIHFDADYVLPEFEWKALLKELDCNKDRGVLYAFKVIGFRNGGYIKTNVHRRWCVNKRLASKQQITLAYGIGPLGGLDNPVLPERISNFTDPVIGIQKKYYEGPSYPLTGIMDVSLYRYGHFFFSSEQLLIKEQRIENAIARYQRRLPVTNPVDKRPYKTIGTYDFLENNQHPKGVIDFLKSLPQVDIVGLRDYEYNWTRKLLAYYFRLRDRYQKLILPRFSKLIRK